MSQAPPHSAKAVRKGVRTSEQVAGRSGSSKSKKQPSGTALKAKEEEYRRLNAELEAKAAELVKEAEHLRKGNLSILCDLETSELAPPPSDSPQRPSTTPSSTSLQVPHHSSPLTHSRPHTSQTHVANVSQTPSHPHTSNTHQKTKKTQLSWKPQPKTARVAAAQGEIPLVEPISVDLERAVQKVEQNLDSEMRSSGDKFMGAESGYHGDNIIPEAAEDMGPEALIRFLKAKLRVTQEELDRLCSEMGAKDKQLQSSEAKIKDLTEQNSRLQRSHQSIQSQVDKHRGIADAMKQKCSGLEAQLVSLRKDVEGMKGRQKKAAGQQSVLEVRLNRALEETEKYKSELASLRARSEDSSKSERQRVEQLIAENKLLEKQRSELVTAFKKQMKLIDILKRQKMHIEAAKMLSFTEEEFVKALDWQSS